MSRGYTSLRALILALFAGCLLCGGTLGCASSSEEPDEPVGAPPDSREGVPIWLQDPEERETNSSDDEAPDENGEARSPAESESPSPSRSQLRTLFPATTVDLDFRRAAIERVMRIFQVKSDRRIVIDPEVEGRLTISADNADVARAFETVLDTADLTCHRRDGTLVVTSADSS